MTEDDFSFLLIKLDEQHRAINQLIEYQKQTDANIMFLAHRLRDLEDRVDNISELLLDTVIDFYSFRDQLSRKGGNWIQYIFHPDCTEEQKNRLVVRLKQLPIYKDKRIKELEEKQEGLMNYVAQNISPTLLELKNKVDSNKGTNKRLSKYK